MKRSRYWPKRELDSHERRSEVWRYGWASLADGFAIVLSGGLLDPCLSFRSALKWLKVSIARQRKERDDGVVTSESVDG